MKKLITSLLLILPFCSCNKTDCPPPPPPEIIKNGSSHTIAIVTKDWEEKIDSLVLFPNEITGNPISGAVRDYNRIYYDNRYVIRYANLPGNRKFDYDIFELTKNDEGKLILLYTFTDQDYQYAVEHGIDLEAQE